MKVQSKNSEGSSTNTTMELYLLLKVQSKNSEGSSTNTTMEFYLLLKVQSKNSEGSRYKHRNGITMEEGKERERRERELNTCLCKSTVCTLLLTNKSLTNYEKAVVIHFTYS